MLMLSSLIGNVETKRVGNDINALDRSVHLLPALVKDIWEAPKLRFKLRTDDPAILRNVQTLKLDCENPE